MFRTLTLFEDNARVVPVHSGSMWVTCERWPWPWIYDSLESRTTVLTKNKSTLLRDVHCSNEEHSGNRCD
jgi:hypothetical protein